MALRLFDDANYVAVLEDIHEHPRNGQVWRGHLADRFHSWVLLVEPRGALATSKIKARLRIVGIERVRGRSTKDYICSLARLADPRSPSLAFTAPIRLHSGGLSLPTRSDTRWV